MFLTAIAKKHSEKNLCLGKYKKVWNEGNVSHS